MSRGGGAQRNSKARRGEGYHNPNHTRGSGLMVISTLLPFEARQMLLKASLAHAQIRARVIDGAITQIRLMYPQLFK